MLRKLFSHLFGHTFYVQVWAERLKVINCSTGESFDEVPLIAIDHSNRQKERVVAVGLAAKNLPAKQNVEIINPFMHPRTLLADFGRAEQLLSQVFKSLNPGPRMLLQPRVIMQAMDKIEGGLTQIEGRALRELALCAGARIVALHSGDPLTLDQSSLEALFQQ